MYKVEFCICVELFWGSLYLLGFGDYNYDDVLLKFLYMYDKVYVIILFIVCFGRMDFFIVLKYSFKF